MRSRFRVFSLFLPPPSLCALFYPRVWRFPSFLFPAACCFFLFGFPFSSFPFRCLFLFLCFFVYVFLFSPLLLIWSFLVVFPFFSHILRSVLLSFSYSSNFFAHLCVFPSPHSLAFYITIFNITFPPSFWFSIFFPHSEVSIWTRKLFCIAWPTKLTNSISSNDWCICLCIHWRWMNS